MQELRFCYRIFGQARKPPYPPVKNSVLRGRFGGALVLGGSALQRCDKRLIFNLGFGPEVSRAGELVPAKNDFEAQRSPADICPSIFPSS